MGNEQPGPLRLNYHDTPEGFLKWAVLSVVALIDEPGSDLWNELEIRTEGWKKISLTIHINGVEVDAAKFMGRLEELIENAAKSKARAMVRGSEKFRRIEQMYEKIWERMVSIQKELHAEFGKECWEEDD